LKSITLKHTELQLLPEKALFLPAFGTLCIADWHLGKAAHFRKSGIPLPQPDLSLEFARVSALITKYNAKCVVLLGDIFHSYINNDWFLFQQFILQHQDIKWVLTIGNHDIIGKDEYEALGIIAEETYLPGENVICSHHPLTNISGEQLNIAGHIHPGCELRADARQRFRLPCFHYHNPTITLPAFGGLTGLHIVHPDTENRVFVIVGEEVKEVKA